MDDDDGRHGGEGDEGEQAEAGSFVETLRLPAVHRGLDDGGGQQERRDGGVQQRGRGEQGRVAVLGIVVGRGEDEQRGVLHAGAGCGDLPGVFPTGGLELEGVVGVVAVERAADQRSEQPDAARGVHRERAVGAAEFADDGGGQRDAGGFGEREPVGDGGAVHRDGHAVGADGGAEGSVSGWMRQFGRRAEAGGTVGSV